MPVALSLSLWCSTETIRLIRDGENKTETESIDKSINDWKMPGFAVTGNFRYFTG